RRDAEDALDRALELARLALRRPGEVAAVHRLDAGARHRRGCAFERVAQLLVEEVPVAALQPDLAEAHQNHFAHASSSSEAASASAARAISPSLVKRENEKRSVPMSSGT